MSTPPDQPDEHKAKLPLNKQLDEMLVKIEAAEPSASVEDVLPGEFDFQTVEEVTQSVEAEPLASADTQQTTPEQADMLAALNSALQDLPSESPAEGLSPEDQLQQEIAALIDSEPQVQAPPASAPTPTENALSTEDQIAMEIESLLNVDQEATSNEPPAPAPTEPPATAESAIDELDKMLASEIDTDDELAGDFQSVEDVTAGIQVDVQTEPNLDDEHAATARDVAAELDTQPEDLPAPPSAGSEQAPADDPFAVLDELSEKAEKNEAEHQRKVAAIENPDWKQKLETAREHLYSFCYLINWPARRLSAEWRANLGYIALLNLFFGVGLWFVLIVF